MEQMKQSQQTCGKITAKANKTVRKRRIENLAFWTGAGVGTAIQLHGTPRTTELPEPTASPQNQEAKPSKSSSCCSLHRELTVHWGNQQVEVTAGQLQSSMSASAFRQSTWAAFVLYHLRSDGPNGNTRSGALT